MISKSEMRVQAHKIRNEGFSKEKNESIIDRFLDSKNYKDCSGLLLTSSIRHEIPTDRIIQQALKDNKQVFLPKTDTKTKEMMPGRIHAYPDDVEIGNYGILEPKIKKNKSNPDNVEIDLILVPGLAFDKKGNRLGYGGGFYDRYLKHSKAKKVSLSYEDLVFDQVPIESFDQKIDELITEDNYYTFAN